MYRIKKIKVLPLAYTIGLIYLLFGLFLGILLVIVKSNPSLVNLTGQDLSGLTIQQIILLYPIAYSAGGFIIGILIGFIYNYVAKYTGGISIQLEKDNKTKKKN